MKEIVQTKMPKILEFNKENSLIFVMFNKFPSSTQRKLLDILLYFGKQYMQKLKITDPEGYSFLEKRSFKSFIIPLEVELDAFFSILDIKRKNRDQIIKAIKHIEDITYEKIDILNENGGIKISHIIDKNEVKEILKKYGDKIKSWEHDRIIVNPTINFNKDVFKCYLSPTITKYIIKNEKYTRINILVHTFLKSTYTINLYDILISRFKAQKEMMDKGKIPKNDFIQTGYIEVEKLQDMLGMGKEHSWRVFKYFNKFILKSAIKEINNSNVIEFEIVEVLRKTKKRKVTELAFLLKPKESFNIPALVDENIILTNGKELIKIKKEMEKLKNMGQQKNEFIKENVKKESHMKNNHIIKLKENILNNKDYTFMDFIKDLRKLKNINITNIMPNSKGKLLKINELGMLELNGEEVDNIKANAIRRILFQNPDLLGRIEEIDEDFEDLKDRFINKVLIFKFQNYYYAIGVKKLEKTDDGRVKVIGDELLRDVKNFEIIFNMEYLKEFSPKEQLSTSDKDYYLQLNFQKELEELEEFFINNKDKFKEWLNILESQSLELSNKLMALKEGSEEYIKVAKELEIADTYNIKGYELLEENEISAIEKKMLLKKFKEFTKK